MPIVTDALASWLRLKPRQLRNALWLGTVLLAITSSYTLVKTSRDALFLSQLPAQWLPYVFLVVGVFTLAVSWAFGRLTHRLTPLQSLIWTAVGSAAALIGFALVFDVRRLWIPVGFYLWVNAYGLILVSQFWAYTNSISDPQEAKHIFGIVGGGGILGGLLGGGLAAWLGPRVPIAWLTGLGAGLLLLMAPALFLAVQKGRVRRADEPVAEEVASTSLARAPYVRWLALAVLCSVIVTGLLDYQLKVVIQKLYPSAQLLAGFFGRFYIAVGVAALLLQLLATRWLLQRFGAGWASALLPAGLAAGAVSTLVTPGFVTVIGTRLWDQILRFSLNKSAVEMFYFPLEQGLRRRAKALIEAGIERFGDALAGLTILGVGLLVETNPNVLAAVVCVLVLIWLVAWWHLRTGYVRELGRNLRRMNLSEHDWVSLRDVSVLKELVRLLESPYERLVLQAIDMLEEAGASRLIESRLGPLLDHPSARVRARALALAAARPDEENRGRIARLIHDPDPKVRLQALRAHCALGEDPSLGRLDEFLDAPDPEVRGTALTCLVEFASEADLPRVRAVVEKRLEGGEAEDRALAAEALGARPWPSDLHELLGPLLEDPDLSVRRAALRSAGRATARDRVHRLVLALGERETQQGAREGLVAFGEGVTGTLGDWLSDLRTPIEVRRTIPRVLGEIPARAAIEALYRCRDRSDVLVFYRILKASNHIRVADPKLPFPAAMVSEDLEYDVKSYLLAELHVRSQGQGEDPSERFLRLVLLERMDQALNRVFRRLGLLHPPASMFSAYLGLMTANPRIRGNAAEYVESVVSAEHRALVMPLLPESRPEARRELASRFGIEDLSPRESLEALLQDDDPWLRACALYLAGRRRESTLRARIAANLEALDARVRETARWAMMALEAT